MTTLAQDTFVDSLNGNDLSAHPMTSLGWTMDTHRGGDPDVHILSNRATVKILDSGNICMAYTTVVSDFSLAKLTVNLAGNVSTSTGLAFRYNPADHSFLLAIIDAGAGFYLGYMDTNSAWNELGFFQFPVNVSKDYVIEVTCAAFTVTAKIVGVTGSTLTDTSGVNNNAPCVGLYADTSVGQQFAAFSVAA